MACGEPANGGNPLVIARHKIVVAGAESQAARFPGTAGGFFPPAVPLVRTALKDFVIHSLRHIMLTRLGEACVDVFAIMRIAGHSGITVSQRYVHPSPEALERAFEKLEAFNRDLLQG